MKLKKVERGRESAVDLSNGAKLVFSPRICLSILALFLLFQETHTVELNGNKTKERERCAHPLRSSEKKAKTKKNSRANG